MLTTSSQANFSLILYYEWVNGELKQNLSDFKGCDLSTTSYACVCAHTYTQIHISFYDSQTSSQKFN